MDDARSRKAMPRRLQTGIAGHVSHTMNRAQPNELLFDTADAYRAFLRLMAEVHAKTRIRILAYCLMPNHWHFVLWPEEDRQVTAFVGRMTMTHAKRLRRFRENEGSGAVYPGRFLSVPLPAELNVYRALRYVERNPIRAGLTRRAEAWPWSSAAPGAESVIAVAPWPLGRPKDWLSFINQEEPGTELESLRTTMYAEPKPKRRRRG
jgi:putative transposase